MPVRSRVTFLAALMLVTIAGCGPSGDPVIEVGPARAAVPTAGSSQVVLEVHNTGDGADTITGADTPAAVGAELHRTTIDNGRAEMRPVSEVGVAPGETVRFQPGGLHLMLVVPDETVTVGGTFDLTLHFERSGDVTVPVSVVDLLDLVEPDVDENSAEPDG